MKKLIAFYFFFAAFTINAQKYCYIDSEYIFGQIDEYEQAQQRLNQLSEQWQGDLENMWDKIGKMKKELEEDAIVLPEELRKQRQELIAKEEQKARSFQKEKFGVDGALFATRTELLEPIQQKLFDAVRALATEGKYSFVFDIAKQKTLMFADPRYDKSDQILKEMGYKKKKNN